LKTEGSSSCTQCPELDTIFNFTHLWKFAIFLPRNKGNRNIILIQPKNFCPEIYPRKVGKPEKNPL